jgi:hypothetical protein
MKNLIFLLIFSFAAPASANIKAKPGVYKITAYLSLQEGKRAQIFVNPFSRARYTLNVQNPRVVAKQLDRSNYFGQVETTIKVYNPGGQTAAAEVQKIKVIKLKRIPAYSGAFKPAK